ncbi:MAG: hypothetical protein IIY04_04505, partial [Oscillospiraceae bacterium]|nr:hypothetical protein [Oscillospiraceae bacterium]
DDMPTETQKILIICIVVLFICGIAALSCLSVCYPTAPTWARCSYFFFTGAGITSCHAVSPFHSAQSSHKGRWWAVMVYKGQKMW